MFTEVSAYDFIDAFKKIRPENFTTAGLRAMFEYFEQVEEDMSEQIELDVIAICVDYSEYENLAELQADYSDEYDSLDKLEESTTVIRIGDSEAFIVASF